jgi:hypothetical protein
MGSAKDRVHPRYRIDLAATARWRRTVANVTLYDVSQAGAFIVSAEHPNLRELVRLEMALPGRAEPFSVHGMAVNFANVGDVEARPTGFGVQLYAMDREMQRLWAQFIDLVKRGGGPRAAPAPVVQPVLSARPAVEEDLPPLVIPEPFMRTPIARVPLVRTAVIEPQSPPPAGTRQGIQAPAAARPAPPAPPAPPRAATPAPPRAATPAPRLAPIIPPLAAPPPTITSPLPPARHAMPPASLPPKGAPLRPFSMAPAQTSGAPGPISLRPGSGAGGPVEFEVDVTSIEELELFHERDASVGGMFIPTDLNLRVRSTLKVFLRHPIEGTLFEIDARVSHVECDLDAPGVGVEFIGFNDSKRAALREFVYGAAVEPARPPPRLDAVWDFEPQGVPEAVKPPESEDDALARLFEPWGSEGQAAQRPWSHAPPEDEFNLLFDALHEREESGFRLSRQPSVYPDEAAPDFRLSVPSWTSLEASPSVIALEDVVDLSDDESIDLVEATPLPRTIDSFSRRQASRA